MFGRCAGLLLPILNGKTVERSERGGDFCYRDKAYCTLAGWRVEKGEIIITDGRFLVERIALSLFKRWSSRKVMLNISYLLFEDSIVAQQIAYIC